MRFTILPFIIAISIVGGILLGDLLHMDIYWGCISISIAMLIYLGINIRGNKPAIAVRLNKLHYLWIILGFAGVGVIAESYQRPESLQHKPHATDIYSGEVEEVTSGVNGDRFIVKIERVTERERQREGSYGNLRAVISTDAAPVKPGDKVIFSAQLQPVSDDPNRIPSGFAKEMRQKGVLYQGYMDTDYLQIAGHKNTINGYAGRCREAVEVIIEDSRLRSEVKSFLCVLLLGDKEYLRQDVMTRMGDTGVSHMIAVSGLHLGIVTMLLLTLLWPIKAIGQNKLRYILIIPAIWIFAIVCGLSNSTLRAAIMITFMTSAIILERKNTVGDTLMWAVIFILLFNPYAIYDVGFQLSVVCVGALIIFVEILNPVNRRQRPKMYKVASSILVTITATLSSWTLISYNFGRIPMLFLPANLVILPILPLYMGLAWLYIIASGVMGMEMSHLGDALQWTYTMMIRYLDILSGENSSAIDYQIGGISVILWLLFVVMTGVTLHNKHNRRRRKRGIICSGVLLAAFAITMPLYAQKNPTDGFIIANKMKDFSIMSYNSRREKEILMPSGSIAYCQIRDKNILLIDKEIKETIPDKAPDIVIIGDRWNGSCRDIEELNRIWGNGKERIFVTHPNIRKEREQQCLDTLRHMKLSCHSLRLQGAYKYFE